ncbi:MAG: Rhodanese-related sulfurtransferase [Chloroflexi bacterium]|jgi:rhodanese-related sulfurtransferase|nr:MAG: Rhodanese-related sulfurtransferase [Chloroflexota bacterium]
MSEQSEPFKRISVDEAYKLYGEANSTVVDVRQLDEWNAGHVSGAIHIPVEDVISRVDSLPSGGDLLFICAQGVRSALACEMAAAMGRESSALFNIEEGTGAWIDRGYPTTYGNDS